MCVCQEAHEQGINAVKFSATSDLLATGGTDRVVKLWDVRAGSSAFRLVTCCCHMTVCSDLLLDYVIARLTDSQSHLDWQHFGHHLRGLQHHGESFARGGRSLTRTCDVDVCCVQGGWVLAASYDKSAQLWQHDESVPKVTTQHIHMSVGGSAEPTDSKTLLRKMKNVITLLCVTPAAPRLFFINWL